MKNFLKIVVLLGCLAPSLVVAERGEPPKGTTMEKYVVDLQTKYIKNWGNRKVEIHVADYLKPNAPKINAVAESYKDSGKAESLKSWDEWSDGVEKSQAKINKESAIQEMFLHRFDDDCGGIPHPSKIDNAVKKICIDCFLGWSRQYEYEYYLPVHLIEITDTPWKTGYGDISQVKTEKENAFKNRYGNSESELKEILKHEMQMMKAEFNKYDLPSGTGKDKLSDFKVDDATLTKIARDIYLNRNKGKRYTFTTGKMMGGTYAFPHVFDAGYHDHFKKEYTAQWGHDGAIRAQRNNICGYRRREKRPVKAWFAESEREFWYSSYALQAGGAKSLKDKKGKIRQITIDGKRTGRPHNYNQRSDRVFTPNDILSEASKKVLENPTMDENCGTYNLEHEPNQPKCLNGQNGEKGPTVALVKDRYFTRASMIAAWRGLFWVTNIIDDSNVDYQSSRNGDKEGVRSDNLKYHPLFNKDYKGRPRSRMQVLSTATGGKYDGIVNGCIDFKGQDDFIPDWSGPKFGSANTPKKESHNNHTVLVQWQYMRNCRSGYDLIPSLKLIHPQYWF